jgi:hypothetical protein
MSEVNAVANTASSEAPDVCELKLPCTLPAKAHGWQTMSVIEDMNDLDPHGEAKIHVALDLDTGEYDVESWGVYLVHVARAIARDYQGCLETDREDGDLFAALIDGFIEQVERIKEKQEKEVKR